MKHYTFVDFATQGYMALVGLVVLIFHNGTVPQWRWLVAAHLLGLVLVHSLIQYSRRSKFLALDFLRHFYPVLLYLWFYAQAGWLNRMFFKEYMDPLTIRWDEALFGFQPSILFMEKLPYLAVSELFYAAYFSYYLMIFGIGLALYRRDRNQFFHYLSVISFVFYVCYACYIVLPIIGPRVFFHDLPEYTLPQELDPLAPNPYYPPAVQAGLFYRLMAFIYNVFEAPGAAFPSSHVAIALCTVYFSFKYLRRIRYPHLITAVLLCLATVYCRYHYAIDVLAGIGTALLLLPLANRLYFRFSNREFQQELDRKAGSLSTIKREDPSARCV